MATVGLEHIEAIVGLEPIVAIVGLEPLVAIVGLEPPPKLGNERGGGRRCSGPH